MSTRRGPGFSGKNAVDISVLLERVLDKNHISEDMNFKIISERFSDVVGTLVEPHVSLVKLEKRTLVLKAANSVWRSELFMQKNAIIAKCNALLGRPFIQSVRLV